MESLDKNNRQHHSFVLRKELIYRELIAVLMAFDLLLILAVLFKNRLGPATDMALAGQKVHAPWVFAGVQLLLSYLPAAVAGIIIPLIFVSFLFALPFLERRMFKSDLLRPVFYMLTAVTVLLTVVGNYL